MLLLLALTLPGCGGGGDASSGGTDADTVSPPAPPGRPPTTEPATASEDAAAPAPLEGTAWVLFALPGAPAPPAGVRATLRLGRDDGRIVVSTGCRGFDGAYTLSGPQIELGLSGASGGACTDAQDRVERDYLAALRQVGSWRLLGDTLDLLGPAGVVARFHP